MNIGLSGKIAAGKTTLAKAISAKYGHSIVSIASSIRKIAETIAVQDMEKLQELAQEYGLGTDLVSTYIGMMQDDKYKPIVFDEDGTIVKNTAFRSLLQDVGAAGRESSGDEMFWVKRAVHAAGNRLVVCDDVRLPAEKECFEKLGYAVVRLEIDRDVQINRVRALYGENFDLSKLDHHTETALDGMHFDHVLKPAPIEEWLQYIDKLMNA
mgnify:CR=1 FL=1